MAAKTAKKPVKTAPRKPPAKKGEQKAKLDAIGIDAICAMIEDDMSHAAIAAKLEIPKPTLAEWLNKDPNRSARETASRVKSARACDQLALAALEAIADDAPTGMIARQREIASHYRWRAKSRNPREYGDALKLDAEITDKRSIEQVDAQIGRLLAKIDLARPTK